MTSLFERHRRATTLIVIGAVVLLAVVATGLTFSLLTKLPTGAGPTATESLLASVTSGPSATPLALSSSTPSASPTPDHKAPAWTVTASMAEFHFNHTATLLPDGKVLVAGGGPNAVATAELYDPSGGRWTATGSLATARDGHTATLLPDGTVLVVGGYYDDILASAELYDPSSGRWTASGSLATARFRHTATLLPDGTVLVVGGYYDDGGDFYVSSVSAELYHPSSKQWTATGSMATARSGHTATLLADGNVLVVGGGGGSPDGSTLASAELYDPSSGRWTATGSMATARGAFTATLLADGRVLVAGGGVRSLGADDPLASAELYDPDSGRWTATGSMATARSNARCGCPQGHTATLLPDGKVLVAGGDDASGRYAELYDPSRGQWSATATMIVGRVGPTATLLSDGRVLVAGGDFSGGPVDLKSAELYDPGSGS